VYFPFPLCRAEVVLVAVGAVGPVRLAVPRSGRVRSGQVRSKSGQLWAAVSLAGSNISSTMEPSAPSGGVAVSASAGRNELQNQVKERASERARKAAQGSATPESPDEQREK
jgi:hypothetical protein